MSDPALRVAIFARYNLTEQYGLAAEFEGMLKHLASRDKVYHISLRGPHNEAVIPFGVIADELPLMSIAPSHATSLSNFCFPTSCFPSRRCGCDDSNRT